MYREDKLEDVVMGGWEKMSVLWSLRAMSDVGGLLVAPRSKLMVRSASLSGTLRLPL